MADNDVQVQLEHLQQEEALIMRELQELEEKSRAGDSGNVGTSKSPAPSHIDDPDEALAELLADCEKEVRDAKGYIADEGPPLHIVRLRPGETGPKSATFLSRPRHTGVDFTVPVTLKAYTDVVRNPIFLNDIRDKIRARAYTSSSEYIADMRLLHRNTVQFNKGPEDAWVVQHAKLLLDAAEDAVESRTSQFKKIETSLRQSSAPARRQNAQQPTTKRKRPVSIEATGSEARSNPPVGTPVEVWWGNPFRRWYIATIMDRAGNDEVLLRYSIDDSTQWVALNSVKWRTPNTRHPASARPKRPEPPPSKKRKAPPVPSSPRSSAGAPINVDTLPTPPNNDFDGFKRIISTRMDDLTESIKEQLQEHASRTQAQMHRSDHLQRILFAVQDAQSVIVASVDKLTSAVNQLRKDVSALKRSGLMSAATTDRRAGHKDEPSALASGHRGDLAAHSKSRGESKLADEDDTKQSKDEAQGRRDEKYATVSKSQKAGTDIRKGDRHQHRDEPLDRKSTLRGSEGEVDDRNRTRDNPSVIKKRRDVREEREVKPDTRDRENTKGENRGDRKERNDEQRRGVASSDEMDISPTKSSTANSEGDDKQDRNSGDVQKRKHVSNSGSIESGGREKQKERVVRGSDKSERLKSGEEKDNMVEENSPKERDSDKRKNSADGNDRDSERSGSLANVDKVKRDEVSKVGKRYEKKESAVKHDSDSSESSEDSSESSSDSDEDVSRTEAAKTQLSRPSKEVKRSSGAGPRKASRFAQAPEETTDKGGSRENGKPGSDVRNGSRKDTDQTKEKTSVSKSSGRNDDP